MPRLLLSDEYWSKLREILLHKAIYNERIRTLLDVDNSEASATSAHWVKAACCSAITGFHPVA
jgi:hypothetical protein